MSGHTPWSEIKHKASWTILNEWRKRAEAAEARAASYEQALRGIESACRGLGELNAVALAGRALEDEQVVSAADRLRALGKPTNCVWFFRPESGLHRYIEIDPDALIAVVDAAETYRVAEQECDRTGEWEPAREAAVVLDSALSALNAALGGEQE